jgi:hypothetical protein
MVTKRSSQPPVMGCKSNLKNLGTAVEMYADDWNGEYPRSLGLLTPNYIKIIPECPEVGSVTYSYERNRRMRGYQDIICTGHSGIQSDECKERLQRLSLLSYKKTSRDIFGGKAH